MKKVFAVEMKRAINIGWIISILGVCFSIGSFCSACITLLC